MNVPGKQKNKCSEKGSEQLLLCRIINHPPSSNVKVCRKNVWNVYEIDKYPRLLNQPSF